MPYSAPGGLNPVTASRLAYTAPAVANVASNAFAFNHWTVQLELVGADITVNGVDDTHVDVHTDGLYAVYVDIDAVPDGVDKIKTLDIEIAAGAGASAFTFVDGVALDEWASGVPCPTYFLAAGSAIIAKVKCVTVGAGTWSYNGGEIRVQRVA